MPDPKDILTNLASSKDQLAEAQDIPGQLEGSAHLAFEFGLVRIQDQVRVRLSFRPGGPSDRSPRRQPWVVVFRSIQPRSGERFVWKIFRHSVALHLPQSPTTPSRAWLRSDGPPGLNRVLLLNRAQVE